MGESGDCRLYSLWLAIFKEHLIELIRLLLEFDLVDRGLSEDLVAHQMLVLV